MTSNTFTQAWIASSAAQNYAWINALSASLDAVGVSLVSGITGAVNLSTGSVSLPSGMTAGNYYSNAFQIRELVSSGKPTIYIRVEYGLVCVASGKAVPCPRIFIGTAVSSTGVLGGCTSSYCIAVPAGVSYPTTQPITPVPFFLSSDGANYLTILVDPGKVYGSTPGYTLMCGCLERTISPSSGEYTGDGAQLLSFAGSGSYEYGTAVFDFTASTTVSSTSYPSSVNPLFTSSGTGSVCAMFPFSVMTPRPFAAMSAALAAYSNDIAAGQQVSVAMFGNNVNYICSGDTYLRPDSYAYALLRY